MNICYSEDFLLKLSFFLMFKGLKTKKMMTMTKKMILTMIMTMIRTMLMKIMRLALMMPVISIGDIQKV